MFKTIKALSRTEMIKKTENINSKCVIISIKDKIAIKPEFHTNENIIDVLYLTFDDEETGNNVMTVTDAKNIVDFVNCYSKENIDLYIHCNGGVSRSAAIVAALQLWNNGEEDIFCSPDKCPNMHCFRLMSKELGLRLSDKDIDDMYNENYRIWVEHLEKSD